MKYKKGTMSKIMKERWKKGIYNSPEYRQKLSNSTKKWIKERGHPRGMLGKKQSAKAIRAISEMCKKRIGDKHPYWKGGSQSYWNENARKITRHKPDECFYCKKKKKTIIVHHINGDITDNRLVNLMKVCHGCHMKICHRDKTISIINKMNKIKLKKGILKKKVIVI